MTEQAIAYTSEARAMQGGELGEAGDAGSSLSRGTDGDDDRPPADAGVGGAIAAASATVPADDGFSDILTCKLPRTGWTIKRLVRLAFLVGFGKSANEISFDPEVGATPGAIYKMAQRLNLRFRDVPNAVLMRLSGSEFARLEGEARRRGMTADALSGKLLQIAIQDDMFRAILDG